MSYYDEAYNIYKVKPYDNDILAHYVQIPKAWSPGKISDKNEDLTPAPKPLDLFNHIGDSPNTLSQILVLAASLEGDATPLRFIQYYLHLVSKQKKIHIHSITTIDNYRAKATIDWELLNKNFYGEVFINISDDRNRVFIVQGMTNEKSKEEWTKQCDYIFRSFAIINNGNV